MCGRFSMYRISEVRYEHDDIPPIYNIAPSMDTIIVTSENPGRTVSGNWGYVPHWASDMKLAPINTRIETAMDKRFFSESIQKRRCLVLADGFFEWDERKVPFRIESKEREVFSFAGIWDIWGGKIRFAIITQKSFGDMEKIHNRMPVILKESEERAWLEKGFSDSVLADERLEIFQISLLVNNPRNNTPEIMKRI